MGLGRAELSVFLSSSLRPCVAHVTSHVSSCDQKFTKKKRFKTKKVVDCAEPDNSAS